MLQILINGLCIGSVYALFALGYALVFSLLGVINFAHGAVFAIGAYLSWSFYTGQWGGGHLELFSSSWPLPLPWAILLSAIISGLLSWTIEKLAFAPLRRRRAEPLLYLVSSLGVGILLVNALLLVYGAETKSFDLDALALLPTLVEWGELRVRGVQLLILGSSLVCLILLLWLFRRSLAGKALRAVAENPTMASLLGIPVERVIAWTFAGSGVLASLAGTLVAMGFSIPGPHFGLAFGLKGLAVIVLGGMGEISGAILGGFVLGLLEAAIPAEFSGYKEALAFALLFLGLLVRPEGLLGRRALDKL